MSDWVDTKEAAQYLRVSTKTARRWAIAILSSGSVRPSGAKRPMHLATRTAAGRYLLDDGEVRRVRDEALEDIA